MSSKQNSKKAFTDSRYNWEVAKDISLHSQSKPNKNPQLFNPFSENKKLNQILNAQPLDENKENKTQLFHNTEDKNPFLAQNNSNNHRNSVIKIKLYKSQIKPHRTTNPDELIQTDKLNLLKEKTDVKDSQIIKSPLIVEQTIDKKAQYKMLIKKIAHQLKRKTKPRTKGYFYMNVIRSEKYMNIVKKIAWSIKSKLGIHPPTNGVFYSYIKKEEELKLKKEKEHQYKLLIKKIAEQLKKRVKLPTCKIIKIYESYRLLIKRIAEALKKTMKSHESIPAQIPDINMDANINQQVVEVVNNEKSIDIDTTDYAKNETEKENCNSFINNNVIEEEKNENNKMDIETNDLVENPSLQKDVVVQNEIQTEQKKVPTENDDINILTYNPKSDWISSSKKKSEEKQISNYTFSKMEVIDNDDIQNSSEQKRPLELNSNQAVVNEIINQTKNDLPEIKIITDEFISPNKNEEIQEEKIICEDVIKPEEKNESQNKEPKLENTEIKKNKSEEDIKYNKSFSKSAKNKRNLYKMSLMKKEDILELNNVDRKIANRSHARINPKYNMDNLHLMFNNIANIEKKEITKDNLNLQDIEITKSNFINQFKLFLEQENIQIINNFPVSTDEKNKVLFQQSNFWYLVITYLFYTNNNLSLYNIFYLLDQYHRWSQDKTIELFYSFKDRIKAYINSNYNKEALDQFLFMNQIENIDKVFERYESESIYPDIYKKNKNVDDLLEMKVNDINYLHNKNDTCDCELCNNDEAIVKKMCDINKKRIEIVNNSSIDILKTDVKKNNSCIIFHNNEELFYKGESKKKENSMFSKSKTILEDGGYFQFIHNPNPNPQVKNSLNEEKIENIEPEPDDNANINEKENENNIIEVKDEVCEKEDIAIDSENSPKKTFKNISKSEKKAKEEKEEVEKIKSEGNEPIEIIKEDIESSDDESKNVKKEKKSRKGKSRKRNNNNKKKKDSITKEKKEEEKEETKNEQVEEEKEDKSIKKKKKSTNRSSLKKNKNKNCVKNEENEEEKEKNESEEFALGSRSVHKIEDEPCINNSKRKKSKTPNKKKSRKH